MARVQQSVFATNPFCSLELESDKLPSKQTQQCFGNTILYLFHIVVLFKLNKILNKLQQNSTNYSKI